GAQLLPHPVALTGRSYSTVPDWAMVRRSPEKPGNRPWNVKVAVTAPPVAVCVVARAAGASSAEAASTRAVMRMRRMARASYPAPPMLGRNVCSVHLHDAQALPSVPARQGGPHRHLAVVLSRRQDRRAGLQR